MLAPPMAGAASSATYGRASAAPAPKAAQLAASPRETSFVVQLQRAAGNRASDILLSDADAELVELAVRSPGLPLDLAVRNAMEGRFVRRPRQASLSGGDPGIRATMPWHEAEREAEALAASSDVPREGESADLRGVRVHVGDMASRSAAALGARAFTVGQDIVFAAGEYQPTTSRGERLLAHELAHTLQQRNGPPVVMRAPDERQTAIADPEVGQKGASTSVGFARFTKSEARLSMRVVTMSHAYRHLVSIVYPLLERAALLIRRRLDYEMYWHGVLSVYTVEDAIEDQDAYDPVRLSEWVQAMQAGLGDLRKLLAATKETGEKNAAEAESLNAQAAALEVQAKALATEKYMAAGFEARAKAAQEADLNRRMDEAAAYIKSSVAFVASSPNQEQMTRWYGEIIAEKLVHRWHLNGDQIRSLFERFRSEGHLNDVLMGGSTVRALLRIGIGGFWEYRAPGEGFWAGAARTELETQVSQPIAERRITGWENLEAVGGFIAGVFQGIGDDIIDNLKSLVELFTPSFWKQIYGFLTEELPHFAADEEYRFQIGSLMGRSEVDEQRRVAGASPAEYGRTMGHACGVVLTEIALLLIGIGWVIKASKASPTIMKIVRPAMKVVNAIARTAAGKKVAEFAVWAAEAIAAIERKIQAILLKFPALTEAGRAEKAVREAQLATERIKSLQVAAQRAAMAGDEEKVVKYMEEFDSASKDLESKLQDIERRGRGESLDPGKSEAPPEKRPETPATAPRKEMIRPAEEAGHTVKITPNGQLMRCSVVCETLWARYAEVLKARPELRKGLIDLEERIGKAYLQGSQAELERVATEAEYFERDLFLGEGMHEHVPGPGSIEGTGPQRGNVPATKPTPRKPKTPAELELEVKMAAARVEKGVSALKIKELQNYVRGNQKLIGPGTMLRDLAADNPEMLEDLWLEHLERLKDPNFKTKDYADYVRKRMSEFRGRMGEFATAFERGPDEIMVYAPKTVTTEPGLDLITYTTGKRIEILDNKAFREGARISKVSAFEKNLAQNMKEVIEDLEKAAGLPGAPPELASDVLPRMRDAQKEIEKYVASVLSKNANANLYGRDVQKEVTRILDQYGIDRRVTFGGGGANVKVTNALLDRLTI
jgi:Domain of unknown function (DUF4157)